MSCDTSGEGSHDTIGVSTGVSRDATAMSCDASGEGSCNTIGVSTAMSCDATGEVSCDTSCDSTGKAGVGPGLRGGDDDPAASSTISMVPSDTVGGGPSMQVSEEKLADRRTWQLLRDCCCRGTPVLR